MQTTMGGKERWVPMAELSASSLQTMRSVPVVIVQLAALHI